MNKYKQRAMKRLFGDSSRKSDTSFKDAHSARDYANGGYRLFLGDINEQIKRLKKVYSDSEDYTSGDDLEFKMGSKKALAELTKISAEILKIGQNWASSANILL